MTQIVDYASLQSAVTEYLARDQDAVLIARIPTFVQLAEAKLNRELFVRQMEQRALAVIDLTSNEPEFIALPADFQSLRRMRLSGVSGMPSLEFSRAQLDEYRFGISDVAGQPRYFTIFGNEIEFTPTPDKAYTVEMVYRRVTATASNDPNWLHRCAGLVSYGALLEAAPYLKDDGRIQTWALGFSAALSSLNNLGLTSTFNAGPMTVRASGQII